MNVAETLVRRFHEAGGSLSFRPPNRLLLRAPEAVLDAFPRRVARGQAGDPRTSAARHPAHVPLYLLWALLLPRAGCGVLLVPPATDHRITGS